MSYLHALEGRRTLLWDPDPQGAAGHLLEVKEKVKGGSLSLLTGDRDLGDAVRATAVNGWDVLPADMSARAADAALEDTKRPVKQLARVLKSARTNYDVLFLDCPPGLSLLSQNVFAAADLLLVPLVPTPLSVRTFDQLQDCLATVDGAQPAVHPFFSMVDGRKRLHADVRAELMRHDPHPDGVGAGGRFGRADGPDARAAGPHRTGRPGRAGLPGPVGGDQRAAELIGARPMQSGAPRPSLTRSQRRRPGPGPVC